MSFASQLFKITESHSAGAVTYSVKAANTGNDPSASNPVSARFCDGSQVDLVSGLSVTLPAGGTIGAVSGLPFRAWFQIVNNGGTPLLAVRNCSDANDTYGIPASGFIDTQTNASPNSAGVSYAPAAVSGKPYLLLGHATYETGLAAAGTWDASPSPPVMYSLGMPLPGQPTGKSVQFSSRTTLINNTASYQNSALTATINLSSAANLVGTFFAGSCQVDTAGRFAYIALRRGGSIIGEPQRMGYGAANLIGPVGSLWTDFPGATSATYVVSTALDGTPAIVYFMSSVAGGVMTIWEIMG